MDYTEDVLPELPFQFFQEISAIPRASGNEKEIADYLEKFARHLCLSCYRDSYNNVLIIKQGSPGREGEPALLLQAHTDMVAEKNEGTVHDFNTDPIELIENGNILSANGTTLGADDGFGVAIMMAILCEAEDHPPLECLFTATEELGMVGVTRFDFRRITASRLVNLDSADEREIIVGCCGGLRTDITLPVTKEVGERHAFSISVSGLCGGHSGEDIHRGRLNALSLMGEILYAFDRLYPLRIAAIYGGNKDNAIPRECEVVIVTENEEASITNLLSCANFFLNRKKAREDEGLQINIKPVRTAHVLTRGDTLRILRLLQLPTGVLAMRRDKSGVPQASTNLASVRTGEGDVAFALSTRSFYDADIAEHRAHLEQVAKEVGAVIGHRNPYSGWESPDDSRVVSAWKKAYHKTSGKKAHTAVIHAGLECGIICGALPGISAISVGCNVHDLHTPAETMEMDSFLRVYRTALEFLKMI